MGGYYITQGPNLVLYDDLKGQDGGVVEGGSRGREYICVCIYIYTHIYIVMTDL